MPDETVTSEDARRRFRELLDSVEHQGAHVTIRRYVRDAAVIVPIDWYTEARATLDRAERDGTDRTEEGKSCA